MKKVIYAIIFMFSINSYCQETERNILEKTVAQLNKIETVFYQSTNESIESGTTHLEFTFSIFFDFRNTMTTPKYYIEQDDMKLIFDGQKQIQSLANEKLIITNNKPLANIPLLLTLYPIKILLPQMLNNENINIIRKKDTVINNIKSYVFDLNYMNGFLDFDKLVLKDFPEANYQTKYTLMINKLNFLPIKMIMPNGPTGNISRTFDNLDFNYDINDTTWTGKNFSTDYEKISFEEYINRMQEKMASNLTTDKSKAEKIKITNWEIPDLRTDKLVDFSKFHGNVVLLEFWFKYCGPCVQAVPDLNKWSQEFKNEAFLLYGVEFREDSPKTDLQEYVSKIKMDYPVLYKGKELAERYSVQAAPTFMIIDKKGEIIYLESGFNKEKIENIIKENL